MPPLRRKRSVQDDGSPRPTAVKRRVLILEDKEQDSDAQADSSFSSELPLLSTSSINEEDTNDVFVDPHAPERRFIRDGVPDEDFENTNTTIRRAHPWVKDIDDVTRYDSRIYIFQVLVARCDWLDQKYSFRSSNSYNLVRDLFEANPWLVSEIDECWSNPEGSFLRVCHLELLRAPRIGPSVPSLDASVSIRATERSWNAEFKGEAADLLLETISAYLSRTKPDYAKSSSIVNSSGMGKSRTVDELSKKIVTVPMCLRGDFTQGFPPPDRELRIWLLGGQRQRLDEERRLHGFIYALLTVTRRRLKALECEGFGAELQGMPDEESIVKRQEKLAAAFYARMQEGQGFQVTGDYRQEFFREVIKRAKWFLKNAQSSQSTGQSPTIIPKVEGKGVQEVGIRLARFIAPPREYRYADGPRRPLIILAFDECHELTNRLTDSHETLYSELRRVLRCIRTEPIFSLFLFTASKFHIFNPETVADPSRRVQEGILSTLPPITELCFDELAYTAIEGHTTLEEVVQDDWMAHLGRPLLGSHYDALQTEKSESLMRLARMKLLHYDGPITESNLKSGGVLACLSVRFALEFDLSCPSTRSVQATQVERHLRICLGASPGLDCLLTVAGSEPFLAKAAEEILDLSGKSAAELLAHHKELNCVDRGQRGELVALLLIMQARDMATKMYKTTSSGRGWIYVGDFMKALLTQGGQQALFAAPPSRYRLDEKHVSFGTMFNDSKIWFNHVIKIEDGDMLHVSELWKFVSRGAMILCPPGHYGIDIVIPVCFKGSALDRNNMTAILIQVKNAIRHRGKISGHLFHYMNPFHVGLYSSSDNPLPVIRLVFALASNVSSITVAPHPALHHGDDFTAYDIWCAGTSPATFGCIGADLPSYLHLLERSFQVNQAYDLVDVQVGHAPGEVASKRGAARRRVRALAGSQKAHNYKYEKEEEQVEDGSE